MEERIIDGTQIKRAYTLGSWFDQNSIEVAVGEGTETFRISANEVLKLLRLATFMTEKKIVHTYLKVKDLVDTCTVEL